jgi:hypothetical protein
MATRSPPIHEIGHRVEGAPHRGARPRWRGGLARHYGPWEQFASLLSEGLVARDHDVTLFATADAVT